MDARTLSYLQDRRQPGPSDDVLGAFGEELLEQVQPGQLRALAYRAGRRYAARRNLVDVRTLSDFESFANALLLEKDWGWLELEEVAGGVDFRHGCAPLGRWFGAAGQGWSSGFFEGMYAEWMRQLGAGEQLDVRELDPSGAPEAVLRFRLAHESSFA